MVGAPGGEAALPTNDCALKPLSILALALMPVVENALSPTVEAREKLVDVLLAMPALMLSARMAWLALA
jgi:hypothetical protein